MGKTKKLGICFVLFRAYPVFNRSTNQAFGGSEVELYNLATYFARFDQFKVDFIVGDYGQKDIENYNNITVRRIRYMREEIYKSFRQKVLRYFYFFWSMLRQSSQIYITKTASEHLGWMVLFLRFLKGKKVVFRLGSDKDTEFEFWKASPRFYHLYKFGLRNSDLIYVQSEDQKRMLMENCGIESKVLKNIFPVETEKCPQSKDYILWVSRCDPLKRPELFLELAGKMPDEKFVMIMPHIRRMDDPESEYENRMTAAAQKAAEELGNFEFHEFVPFHQIHSYYDHAKLFVNTSEYEGFPNSFIQSCIGRTGILSFRVNPDEFLTKYSLGYCCEDNPEKAVDFIGGLDTQAVLQLGENAFDYVRQNHDVSEIGKSYREDFIKLTGWHTAPDAVKSLKICIISFRSLPLFDERYNCENVIGGAEVNLYNLAVCLSGMKNIEVKMLVDDFGQPAVYKKGNVELIRFSGSLKQLVSLDADAFIFSCSHSFLGKLVFFQKILRKRKVFFRLSSDLNMDLENFKEKNGTVRCLAYKFGLERASAIISQTEKQRSLLEQKFGVGSTVIENGFFIRRQLDVKEKRHILWVGRCMESKRPMLFLKLAERLPEEEFVMIMPINKEIPASEFKGREELAVKVCNSARTLKNVKMIDYVPFNEIQVYFDQAKAYVCTSELEGFPNTYIQACLGAAPILAYRVDPDNIIGKYGLGCLCKDNENEAVTFIKGIDPASLLEYEERMLKYSAQKHNIYSTAMKYLELIDKDFKVELENRGEANASV